MVTEQTDRSFFWTLAQRAGSKQRENQLSSTFAACFAKFTLVPQRDHPATTPGRRITTPLGRTGWVCSEQVCPPKGGRERITSDCRHRRP